MHQKKRGIGFMLALLCTFTLLLAACRAGPEAQRQTLTQRTTRLNLRETPGVMDTTTPGTMTPGTTTPGVTLAPTEYAGQVPAENALVGLSTTGKRMVAFVTDGTQNHPPTFAQWFRASVTNGVIDTSTPAKTGADRLQATLTNNTATGSVTLANGKSIAFTANAIPDTDQTAGLYRSEHEINKQRYVAGWIVLPAAGAAGTATPSAVASETASPSASATPSAVASETASPSASATPSAVASETASPSASATPSAVASETASPSASATPSATVTGTPTLTPSATTTATGALQQGGALLNEQTFAVQSIPPLTQAQINAKEVTVPNEAIFKLVPCQKNLC